MEIEKIQVGEYFLAPLAGVSDVGFRKVARLGGADLTVTEMINCNALLHNNKSTQDLLLTSEEENPCSIQIFGKDEKVMATVCTDKQIQKFDFIDFNFGCPAPKIVKNGEGSALLKNLNQIKKILVECKKVSSKPLTAKFRIGFNNGENVAVDMAKLCEDCGVSAITVHGRTREQMYSGIVDYETIAKVKQNVKIPVIGNGDITNFASLEKMKQTGVDGFMIGRGALGKPWIFNELKNLEIPNTFEMILTHVNTLREHFSERFINLYMRKHFLWYIKDIPNAAKYRTSIALCNDINKSLDILKSIYDKNI